jgi:ABC-type branched-subunit amino acid transport system substrate-binding protein
MRRQLRWTAVIAAACLIAVGCTSESSDDDGSSGTGDSGPGNTVGITGDTIKISLIYSDLSVLSEQNLAPEIGDAKEQAEAIVADINENGGIAGRKVQLVSHVLAGAEAILSPEAGRTACTQATEDDKPFAVILTAAISADVVRCTAVEHDFLTITMDSWTNAFYDDAEGRLFSVATHTSIGREREYAAWPKALDAVDALDGKTIGIITAATGNNVEKDSVDGGLKPSLEELGYDVAAEFELPCPEGSQTCAQHDAAIQKMKDAGVDFVFLVAQTLVGSATVQSAQKLGFEPQWAVIGNNVTDTVARFYTNAKDNYDGAWGLDTVFPDPSEEADDCNATAVAGGAEEFPEGSDGYGFTAVTCMQLRTLFDAIESIDGEISQEAAIEALENMGTVPMSAGPDGSLSPGKHDAGDAVFLSRYSAQSETFEPYDDAKPIEVD